MVRFSVISPVYNTSEYLPEFIESVIGQTYTDFELILVDDGSVDRSLEICREYAAKDGRITVLTQKNQGSGHARNAGIEQASGDYLLFYDSDDIVDRSALGRLAELLDGVDADLLIYGAEEIRVMSDGSWKKIGSRIPGHLELSSAEECRERFCDLIFSSILNPPWNKVYGRKFVMEHNVRFADTRRAQDAFFNMEFFRHINSLYSVGDVLYYYRANDREKEWKKYPKDLYKIDVRYNSYLEDVCKEFGVYDGEDRRRVDRWFLNSVFRDAGFFRNPLWKLSGREKRDYVSMIITDPYNFERAGRSWTSGKKTERIRKRILSGDARGMMRDVRLDSIKTGLYDFYSRSLRKIIRRNA